MNQIRILNTAMAIKETCEALLSYAEGLDAYIEGKESQEDFEAASRELANGLINLAGVIRNLPCMPPLGSIGNMVEASQTVCTVSVYEPYEDKIAKHLDDYEPCGECGFDHGYEQDEAVRAHKAH